MAYLKNCYVCLFTLVVALSLNNPLSPLFSSALAASSPPCRTYDSAILARRVRYCVTQNFDDAQIDASRVPVIFFFHGITRNALYWWEGGYSVWFKSLTAQGNMPAASVVTFDTEGMSFFVDHRGFNRGPQAYESWFLNEFVDYVTKKHHLCSQRNCRALVGESMGGYGALKNALKRPNQFGYVAVSSPALPPAKPSNIFAADSSWENFFSRQSVGRYAGMLLLKELRRIFGDAGFYEANDPSTLALNFYSRNPSTTPFPNIFINVGGRDQFGFDEGYHRFLANLSRVGVTPQGFYSVSSEHFHSDHTLHLPLMKYLSEQFRGAGFVTPGRFFR